MKSKISLVNTNCWSSETCERYCCEIAITILSKVRNEIYSDFVRDENSIRNETACELSFSQKTTKYFIEHSTIGAYEKQCKDQSFMVRGYEAKTPITRLKAKIIEQFPGGPGGIVSIDKAALDQGVQYRASIYKRKIEKLLKYNGVRILVMQSVDISAIGDPFLFYREIIPLSKNIDCIFYLISGHKDIKYWLPGDIPVYCWQQGYNEVKYYNYDRINKFVEQQVNDSIELHE